MSESQQETDQTEVPTSALNTVMGYLRDDPSLDLIEDVEDNKIAEAIVEINEARDVEWSRESRWKGELQC